MVISFLLMLLLSLLNESLFRGFLFCFFNSFLFFFSLKISLILVHSLIQNGREIGLWNLLIQFLKRFFVISSKYLKRQTLIQFFLSPSSLPLFPPSLAFSSSSPLLYLSFSLSPLSPSGVKETSESHSV